MIKVENISVSGWEAAIRGMRNPHNSWDKSDSGYYGDYYRWAVGKADLALMRKLAKAGSCHAKYRRMINVTMDITAPLYFWKEASTYKVGTVCNSCSTMHKIHDKKFMIDDFSHEHLSPAGLMTLYNTIERLNIARDYFNGKYDDTLSEAEKQDKKAYWWDMIQLLPSSYNQLRTVQLNYEVLANIYKWRKDHKLDEWREFCRIMKEQLPYSELFTLCETEEEQV